MSNSPGGRATSAAIKTLAVITTVGMLYVNTNGFIDTETGSAFGCGHEWPLCNGTLIPSKWGLHTIIEFSHRAGVGVVTILLLLLGIWAWIRYRRFVEAKILVGISIGFVFLEALLGALGVLFVDPPPLLATHFGVALIAFDAVLLLTILVFQLERRRQEGRLDEPLRPSHSDPSLRKLGWGLVIYTYLAMYVGAWVASSGSGGTFQGFPLPTEAPSGTLHYFLDWSHRLIAFGLIAGSIWLVYRTSKIKRERKDLYWASVIALILVCLQAFSGAYLIASHISMPAFLVHVTNITAFWGAITTFAALTLPEPNRHVSTKRSVIGGNRTETAR